MTLQPSVQTAYALARERFAELGVDTDAALKTLDAIPISLHCWQGDDVCGFENPDGDLTGGIQVSGSYPGRARTATQLRADLDFALQQIPGAARLNLHAIYLEADKPVERDAIQPEHFRNWVSWAKQRGLGLDFNPTYFSHPSQRPGTDADSSIGRRSTLLDRPWLGLPERSASISARNSALHPS